MGPCSHDDFAQFLDFNALLPHGIASTGSGSSAVIDDGSASDVGERATGSGHDGYAHMPPLTGPSGVGANIGQYELYHYYGRARGRTFLTNRAP